MNSHMIHFTLTKMSDIFHIKQHSLCIRIAIVKLHGHAIGGVSPV